MTYQYARLAEVMMFIAPPMSMGGQRAPRNMVSEVHAYMSVVTTWTALVAVGYTLICQVLYAGSCSSQHISSI